MLYSCALPPELKVKSSWRGEHPPNGRWGRWLAFRDKNLSAATFGIEKANWNDSNKVQGGNGGFTELGLL